MSPDSVGQRDLFMPRNWSIRAPRPCTRQAPVRTGLRPEGRRRFFRDRPKGAFAVLVNTDGNPMKSDREHSIGPGGNHGCDDLRCLTSSAWGLNAGKPGRGTHVRVLRAAEGKPLRRMDSLTSDDGGQCMAGRARRQCDKNADKLYMKNIQSVQRGKISPEIDFFAVDGELFTDAVPVEGDGPR
jgi:hypothetical protein